MASLLVLAVFAAWWIHTARVLGSSWPDTLAALALQLACIVLGMLLLPKWAWVTLLVLYLLRPWWTAYRTALRTQRTPAELNATPLEEAGPFPPELMAAVEERVRQLAEAGFLARGAFVRQVSHVRMLYHLLESPELTERATVFASVSAAPRRSPSVQLTCRLANGVRLQVNAEEWRGEALPGYVEESFPGVEPPARLVEVFHAYRAWRFPGIEPVRRELPIPDSWKHDYQAQLEASVRAGRLVPAPDGGYAFTRRSAAAAVLGLVFPGRQIRALLTRWRARRLLRLLGQPPATPPPLSHRHGDLRGAAALAIAVAALLPLPGRPAVGRLPAGFTVPADYGGAVRALERLARTRAAVLEISDPELGDSGGMRVMAVPVSPRRSGELVAAAEAPFRARGFFLFRYERSFGIPGMRDQVALSPRYDPYALMRAAGTNGANYDIDTEAIIRFLEGTGRTVPLAVTGFGSDYVEARFLRPLTAADAEKLAAAVHAFCPDVVTQGTGTERALRKEMRETGTLFCWWD